jgi:hypothetical protein
MARTGCGWVAGFLSAGAELPLLGGRIFAKFEF